MDSIIEAADGNAKDKALALLATLDEDTRKLLADYPGTGERGGLTAADYEKVLDILYEKTGKVPTQYIVYKATGCSYSRIGPALRKWKANFETRAHPVEEKEITPIPEALAQVTSDLITSAVQEIGGKIWEASAAFHEKKIETERQVMQAELLKAEQAISDANQASDDITEDLNETVAKNKEITALLDAEKARVVELAGMVDTLKDDVASERGRTQEIERERDNERAESARLQVALSHSEGELEKLKALLQAAEQRFEASEANARQAREDAEKSLNDLRANLENERSKAAADREAADRRERNAAAEVDGLKKEKAEFKRAIDAGRERAERDVTEAKAEAKRALAEQAAAYEDRLSAAKSEAAAARQTVESLSEQIAMLKKRAEQPKGEKKPGESAPKAAQAEAGGQSE